MILLAAYAFFVWYLAIRYRRRWGGYVSVVAGVLGLLLVVRPVVGEHALGSLFPPAIRGGLRQLSVLIVPEAGLIALVGLFVASLPRVPGATQCRCGYDLRGLRPLGLVCPECGRTWQGPGSGLEKPPIELTPVPTARRREGTVG